MKKYLRSLMFDALLALVLLWGLVSPQSAAMNFVAAWALYVCFVCITASIAGVVAYEHWLRNTGKSIPVNPDLMKVFRAVFCRKPSQGASGMVSHYFLCYHGLSAWGWLDPYGSDLPDLYADL